MPNEPLKIIIDPDAGGTIFGLRSKDFNPEIFPPTPEEKQPMIGTFFNLAPADYDRLKSLAKEVGKPVSQLCREAVGEFLNNLEEPCDLPLLFP